MDNEAKLLVNSLVYSELYKLMTDDVYRSQFRRTDVTTEIEIYKRNFPDVYDEVIETINCAKLDC